MDAGDQEPKRPEPLASLQREDLATASLDELERRLEALHSEIERVEGLIEAKRGSRAAADAVFKI